MCDCAACNKTRIAEKRTRQGGLLSLKHNVDSLMEQLHVLLVHLIASLQKCLTPSSVMEALLSLKVIKITLK